MRMTGFRAAIGRLRTEEHGVSAVIVGVSLVALFGSAVLSVDAGNLWQSRRNIVTGTDAAVLQEARTAALLGPNAACVKTAAADPWETMVTSNSADSAPLACDKFNPGNSQVGYVVVEADKLVEARFGGVLGIGDQRAYSASAAMYGFVTAAIGLRPMGFCYENSHFQEWRNLHKNPSDPGFITQAVYNALRGVGPEHPVYSGAGVVHRVSFTKDNPNQCGSNAPGNWGWFDFDGGSNSNNILKDWIQDGYPGNVGINDCNADVTPGDACLGDTGSSGGSVDSALNSLICPSPCKQFPIPLFKSVTGTGSNATFEVWGFVGVKLWGYDKPGGSGGYFDFEFTDIVLSGTCCTTSNQNTGVKGIKICSVDHDSQTVASRCTPA